MLLKVFVNSNYKMRSLLLMQDGFKAKFTSLKQKDVNCISSFIVLTETIMQYMLQSFTVSKCLQGAPSINSCCNVGVVRETINKLHRRMLQFEALEHAHESCMEKDNTVVFSVILKSEKRVIFFLEFSTVLDATNKFCKI